MSVEQTLKEWSEKKKLKFKDGSIEIIWDKSTSVGGEYEFLIRGNHVMTIQDEGIKDLMNCLVKLTNEFKRIAELQKRLGVKGK